MKNHLCICGQVMETKGAFHQCARCEYVYKDNPGGGLDLVRIRGEKPTPAAVGLDWFAKMKAAL